MRKTNSMPMSPEQIKVLIDTALGNIKADLAIVNGDLVNVYSGELLPGYSVAIKGERIAFVGLQDGDYDIWTMNKDGTDHKRLEIADSWEMSPVWSPGGEYLAFSSEKSGYYEIWVEKIERPIAITHPEETVGEATPNTVTRSAASPAIEPTDRVDEEQTDLHAPTMDLETYSEDHLLFQLTALFILLWRYTLPLHKRFFRDHTYRLHLADS